MRITKKIGIISILLCLCGLCIYGIGYAGGGMKYVQAKESAGIKHQTKKLYLVNQKKLQSVHTIKANLRHIDLQLKPSKDDNFYISYNLYGKNKNNPLKYSVKSGILSLKETKGQTSSYYRRINFNFLNLLLGKQNTVYYQNLVTVYIPANAQLENSVLNLGEGDLEMKNLHGKTTQIQLSEGDLEMKNVSLETAAISLENGDINAAKFQASGSVTMAAEDGDISLSLKKSCTKNLHIFLETEDGDLSVKKSLGGKVTKKGNKQSYEKNTKDAASELKATSKYGDISLK